MTKPLSLPEHYVQRVIQDMLPGDIIYPEAEDALRVDDRTLEPRIDKYCPITKKDEHPRHVADRCGIMHIVGPEFGRDGAHLLDLRHLDKYSVEQESFTSDSNESYDVYDEEAEDLKNFITPLGYIALNATGDEELLVYENKLVQPALMYLATYGDDLASSALRKMVRRLQFGGISGKKTAKRPNSAKLPLFKHQ